MPAQRPQIKGNKAKSRRSMHNKETGKYTRQFARTVARLGRWRGKTVTPEQLRESILTAKRNGWPVNVAYAKKAKAA